MSPVLAGEKTVDDIILNDEQWYQDSGITLHKGHKIVFIDRAKRQVHSDKGITLNYDRLLLATGSNPFMIPVPGHTLSGVVSFRDIQDVHTMLDAAHQGQKAVVIGGGLLGLEAANGLLKPGMQVTVVHLLDSLMNQRLEKRGLTFLMEAQTAGVTGIRFKDGKEMPADLVVMAVGIRRAIL